MRPRNVLVGRATGASDTATSPARNDGPPFSRSRLDPFYSRIDEMEAVALHACRGTSVDRRSIEVHVGFRAGRRPRRAGRACPRSWSFPCRAAPLLSGGGHRTNYRAATSKQPRIAAFSGCRASVASVRSRGQSFVRSLRTWRSAPCNAAHMHCQPQKLTKHLAQRPPHAVSTVTASGIRTKTRHAPRVNFWAARSPRRID